MFGARLDPAGRQNSDALGRQARAVLYTGFDNSSGSSIYKGTRIRR